MGVTGDQAVTSAELGPQDMRWARGCSEQQASHKGACGQGSSLTPSVRQQRGFQMGAWGGEGAQPALRLCSASAGEREPRSPCLAVLCSSRALLPGLALAFV